MALAISGRRRAWWLIGLAPVLALFAHRFALGPAAGRISIAGKTLRSFPPTRQRISDDDWVVGLAFGDDHFAYPYATLFSTPVVIQADHEKLPDVDLVSLRELRARLRFRSNTI